MTIERVKIVLKLDGLLPFVGLQIEEIVAFVSSIQGHTVLIIGASLFELWDEGKIVETFFGHIIQGVPFVIVVRLISICVHEHHDSLVILIILLSYSLVDVELALVRVEGLIAGGPKAIEGDRFRVFLESTLPELRGLVEVEPINVDASLLTVMSHKVVAVDPSVVSEVRGLNEGR